MAATTDDNAGLVPLMAVFSVIEAQLAPGGLQLGLLGDQGDVVVLGCRGDRRHGRLVPAANRVVKISYVARYDKDHAEQPSIRATVAST